MTIGKCITGKCLYFDNCQPTDVEAFFKIFGYKMQMSLDYPSMYIFLFHKVVMDLTGMPRKPWAPFDNLNSKIASGFNFSQ